MPRVLLVDDHEVVRHGVRHILETQDNWTIVGEASNGQEAIQLNRDLKPDVIVMDITMPVMNGLDATREIVRAHPDCKVLILTMHEGPTIYRAIQHTGAKGMLTKSQAMNELTPALKAIIAGHTYFHSNVLD
jgi:DNA-binding NarL/FixJ family response regulator